jgi:tetratricopeptide (TPR) repeat protein
MAHIPDDELAFYAFNPQMVAAARREEIEREIASCTACRTSVDFTTASDLELGDRDVWEPLAESPTLHALRELAARVAAEDEEAAALLAPMLATPALAPWTDLATLRRYRTGGVVRKLIAQAATLHEREPLDALTFADAAISVAEALPPDLYPAKAVHELRGTAWKERANALSYLGRFEEGLESCRRAERAFRELVVPGAGLASVAYVRGSILFEQQHYDQAEESIAFAALGFSHVGDEERRMRAIHLQGVIAYERRLLDRAAELFQRVFAYGESARDPLWMARGAQALANCCIERGELGDASRYFHRALNVFRILELRSEVTRTEWGLARVLLASGRTADAVRQLRDVVIAFERGGMATDAALAGLDLADGLLLLGKEREISALAARLFKAFSNAGMLAGALSAVAYLKEAAERGTVAPLHVETVRRFLRRRQPDLLFAPSPDNFS